MESAGSITGVTADGDTVVSYTYDYLGRLSSVSTGNGSAAQKTTYSYMQAQEQAARAPGQ